MPVQLNPDGRAGANDGAGGFLAGVRDYTRTVTDNPGGEAMNATRWMHSIMETLDANLRSVRNGFFNGAEQDTGTTAGTLPVLGAGGKLHEARLPATFPSSKITSGVFAPARIPRMFARKITSGRFDPAIIGGLPARKIQSIGGAKLTDAQLPLNWRRDNWTTRAANVGVGGPGALDEDGETVGTTDAFVQVIRVTDTLSDLRFTWSIQGTPNVANTLRVQIYRLLELPPRTRNTAFCGSAGDGVLGVSTGTATESAVEDVAAQTARTLAVFQGALAQIQAQKNALGLCSAGFTGGTGSTSSTSSCGASGSTGACGSSGSSGGSGASNNSTSATVEG